MSGSDGPRILLYTAQLSATGGGQHALSRLALALAEGGISVHLVTEPPFIEAHRYSRWLRAGHIPIEVLPGLGGGRSFQIFATLAQWLGALPWALLRWRNPAAAWRSIGEILRTLSVRRRNCLIGMRMAALTHDVACLLHIWGPSAITPELLGWAHERGVPAIYHEMGEGDAAYVETWGLSRTVETVSLAACVICCSKSVARNIEREYHYPGPIHTIPFPVDDPPQLPPRPAGGPVVFGAIGRLVPHKRHAELIRALRALRDQGCAVDLLIAGEGPARPALEQLVGELGLSEHVRFTGEFEDLAAIMAQFDVFALMSVSESQCMPITESMAYGKAVIASRFGGMPDFVEHGVTGILVEPGDEAGLVSAMRSLAADQGLRQRLGDAGRARYLERYREDALVARYLRLYADLLQRDP